MKKITVIEHTADIGIRAYGKDLKEAFANTAYGMFNLIGNLAKVKEKEKIFLEVSARDKDDLLVSSQYDNVLL